MLSLSSIKPDMHVHSINIASTVLSALLNMLRGRLDHLTARAKT